MTTEAPKLTDIHGLRAEIFAPESAPSTRWIRDRVADGSIPHVRIGRLIFFNPPAVRAALEKRTLKASR